MTPPLERSGIAAALLAAKSALGPERLLGTVYEHEKLLTVVEAVLASYSTTLEVWETVTKDAWERDSVCTYVEDGLHHELLRAAVRKNLSIIDRPGVKITWHEWPLSDPVVASDANWAYVKMTLRAHVRPMNPVQDPEDEL